jgi:hypothetical protein
MSSFIVKEKTINRIVTFLDRQNYRTDILAGRIKRIMEKYHIVLNSQRHLDVLANVFLLLNKKGTDYRYDVNNVVTIQKFESEKGSNIQVLKSIECLLYQADEGDIPNTKPFKFLEEVAQALKDDIISNLAEYNKAEWG